MLGAPPTSVTLVLRAAGGSTIEAQVMPQTTATHKGRYAAAHVQASSDRPQQLPLLLDQPLDRPRYSQVRKSTLPDGNAQPSVARVRCSQLGWMVHVGEVTSTRESESTTDQPSGRGALLRRGWTYHSAALPRAPLERWRALRWTLSERVTMEHRGQRYRDRQAVRPAREGAAPGDIVL